MLVTKRFVFSSAHQLSGISLHESDNRKLYGKCAALHGHNYLLDITVKGTPDRETGMVIDFSVFKDIVQQHIVAKLDHKNITEDIAHFARTPATCENIVQWIWQNLKDRFDTCQLYRIVLCETENNRVEYYGD